MVFHPAHQISGDQPPRDRAEKAGANHIGGKTGGESGSQRGFIRQRIGGISGEHRHHQDAEHPTAQLAVHPQPGVLLIEEMLQAEHLRQQHRHGQYGSPGDNQRHGERDAAQQRLF